LVVPEGDELPLGVPPELAVLLAPGLVDDVVPDVVPAALLAAVFANRVVIPNAATTLSSVARQVSRDNRRNPVSR
jgi:hypothetical protein